MLFCISQNSREEIEEKESSLQKLQDCLTEAELKANELRAAYENFIGMLTIHFIFIGSSWASNINFFFFQNLYLESAKSKVDVFEEAENELKEIETGLESAETVQPS